MEEETGEECNKLFCATNLAPQQQQETRVEELKQEEGRKTALGVSESQLAGWLGIFTGACTLVPEPERDECWKAIEPLEGGKKEPREILRDYGSRYGLERIKGELDALRMLVEEVESELKK